MKNWIRYSLIGILGLILFGTIGLGSMGYYFFNYSQEDYTQFDEENWVNPLDANGIQDNKELYNHQEAEIRTIYLTILEQQPTDKSFEEMIRANDVTGERDIQLQVLFETEEKNFINNGLYMKQPNATLEIKGKSSQEAPVKSFKVKLSDQTGLWEGQTVINLNKDYFDTLRIRNKLAYDLISKMPDLTSFQTQFVRLFIRDLSSEEVEAGFVDYGFFTHVEQPNKMYLKNHHLDPNAQLYQAENFDFTDSQGVLLNKDHPDYKKSNFETLLEIKGSDDHKKLLDMLAVVNDKEVPIQEVIEKYFDEDNYLTWMATNILLGNDQVAKENYLLYSPLNSRKWYFIPYDFNNALGNKKEKAKWQQGIGIYWDNALHKRYLSNPQNVEALTQKVNEIASIITPQKIQEWLEKYESLVLANLTRLPDFGQLSVEFENFLEEYYTLPDQVTQNHRAYEQSLHSPMPFHTKQTSYQEGTLNLSWEASLDLLGDPVTYQVQLAKDEAMTQMVHDKKGIEGTSYTLSNLPAGTYYLKVIAHDNQGNTQASYAVHKDYKGDKLYGVEPLYLD